MKKLIGISLVAMLAVSPLAANAAAVAGEPAHIGTGVTANDVTASADPEFALVEENSQTDGNAASAGYVKGAYNAAIKAINKVNAKQTTSAGNGIAKSSAGVISVTAKPDEGIVVDANGVAVNYDNSTIDINATSKKLEVKAGGIDTTQLADSAVTTAKLDAEAVTFAKVASAAVVDSTTGIAAAANDASDEKLVTEKAVRSAMDTATNGMVTLTGTQELSNKTLNGGTIKTGTTLTATGATISGGTISGATIDASANTISNIAVSQIATSAKATGTADNDKVTTKGYVDDKVSTATTGMATQTGVDNTIDALTATVNDDFALANGTVTGAGSISIMADWSNPNTATTLSVAPGTFAVATGITEGTVTINKTAYATANSNP